MIRITWKYLFEVQLLHEYYLAANQEDDFFALPDEERWSRIRNRIENRTYSIWDDLELIPTAETEKLLQRYHLKFIKTETGFFIGIEVRPGEDAGTDLIPVLPVTEALELNFRIRLINSSFFTITCSRQQRTLPALYHFNNYTAAASRELPVLSQPVEGFTGNRHYEMGEMAMFFNELKQAIVPSPSGNTGDWKIISSSGPVSEADRMLLPRSFTGSFRGIGATELDLTLKSPEGEPLKTLHFSDSVPIERIRIDFEETTGDTGDGIYDLQISINGEEYQTKKVLLSSALYDPYSLGIISIRTDVDSPLFRIFRTDGALDHTRNNSNGSKHPLFDVRFKSRLSHWHYISRSKKELFTTGITDPFLAKAGDRLHTRKPLILKASASEFSSFNESLGLEETIFLPNPGPTAIQMDENGSYYMNIYTSKIEGLIDEN